MYRHGKLVFSKECTVPPFPHKRIFGSKLSHQEFTNAQATNQGLVCQIQTQFGIPSRPKCQGQSSRICNMGMLALASLPRTAKRISLHQVFLVAWSQQSVVNSLFP